MMRTLFAFDCIQSNQLDMKYHQYTLRYVTLRYITLCYHTIWYDTMVYNIILIQYKDIVWTNVPYLPRSSQNLHLYHSTIIMYLGYYDNYCQLSFQLLLLFTFCSRVLFSLFLKYYFIVYWLFRFKLFTLI